jgi:hypothetical protein
MVLSRRAGAIAVDFLPMAYFHGVDGNIHG